MTYLDPGTHDALMHVRDFKVPSLSALIVAAQRYAAWYTTRCTKHGPPSENTCTVEFKSYVLDPLFKRDGRCGFEFEAIRTKETNPDLAAIFYSTESRGPIEAKNPKHNLDTALAQRRNRRQRTGLDASYDDVLYMNTRQFRWGQRLVTLFNEDWSVADAAGWLQMFVEWLSVTAARPALGVLAHRVISSIGTEDRLPVMSTVARWANGAPPVVEDHAVRAVLDEHSFIPSARVKACSLVERSFWDIGSFASDPGIMSFLVRTLNNNSVTRVACEAHVALALGRAGFKGLIRIVRDAEVPPRFLENSVLRLRNDAAFQVHVETTLRNSGLAVGVDADSDWTLVDLPFENRVDDGGGQRKGHRQPGIDSTSDMDLRVTSDDWMEVLEACRDVDTMNKRTEGRHYWTKSDVLLAHHRGIFNGNLRGWHTLTVLTKHNDAATDDAHVDARREAAQGCEQLLVSGPAFEFLALLRRNLRPGFVDNYTYNGQGLNLDHVFPRFDGSQPGVTLTPMIAVLGKGRMGYHTNRIAYTHAETPSILRERLQHMSCKDLDEALEAIEANGPSVADMWKWHNSKAHVAPNWLQEVQPEARRIRAEGTPVVPVFRRHLEVCYTSTFEASVLGDKAVMPTHARGIDGRVSEDFWICIPPSKTESVVAPAVVPGWAIPHTGVTGAHGTHVFLVPQDDAHLALAALLHHRGLLYDEHEQLRQNFRLPNAQIPHPIPADLVALLAPLGARLLAALDRLQDPTDPTPNRTVRLPDGSRTLSIEPGGTVVSVPNGTTAFPIIDKDRLDRALEHRLNPVGCWRKAANARYRRLVEQADPWATAMFARLLDVAATTALIEREIQAVDLPSNWKT